jgi:hypothetical protein
MVRSLLVSFTTNLTQLARQTDRDTPCRGARQYFERWLERPQGEPQALYAHLTRFTRGVLGRRKRVLLLIDLTFLESQWAVLQVSVPWQRRALPLYREVRRWEDPTGEEKTQAERVAACLKWLKKHLPGPLSR